MVEGLYLNWSAADRSSELHIFARGSHGFGMVRQGSPSDRWIDLLGDWLADKGFDSDRFRARIAEAGAEAVIPSIPARSRTIPYDKHIYKERNLIERFFNKIKHFRRIATRYEKTALSFASMLFLVGAMIWLR